MSTPTGPASRALELYEEHLLRVFARRDRLFVWLLLAQWAFGIFVALTFSPYGWEGKLQSTNLHVPVAVLLGGLVSGFPILLTSRFPGHPLTRHVVAAAQILWSALLIHLTGGRIETHFHVFGSLAFLAYYRDWKVLLTATFVVAADHLVRGFLWPESVYGIVNPEWWRFLEHAWWVVFEDIVLVLAIFESRGEMRTLAQRHAEMEELNRTFESRVEERSAELTAEVRQRKRAESERLGAEGFSQELLRHAAAPIVSIDATGTILSASDAVEGVFQWSPTDLIGKNVSVLMAEPDRSNHDGYLRAYFETGNSSVLGTSRQVHGRRRDGTTILVELSVTRVHSSLSPLFVGIMRDLTARRKEEEEQERTRRLEAIGQLAAGIAHEINTPVQFVSDSVHFVRDSMQDLEALIESYSGLRQAVALDERHGAAAASVIEAEEAADLPYLLEHVPKALDRSLEGLERVATIVRSMKEFAHPDQKEMAPVDLNQAIRSTLTIARNEYKYVADLRTDLGSLPPVTCLAGELNQVILNLVVNAAHAIGDVVQGTGQKGCITVCTRQEGEDVLITVEDTGGGIPEHIRDRVFDPFFTTKEVGRGTGQGLAIARTVVVEKHAGSLTFETEPGRGTTFHIRLPVDGRVPVEGAA